MQQDYIQSHFTAALAMIQHFSVVYFDQIAISCNLQLNKNLN